MYTVQNKVLPGAYINFVSAARASATLGDRGTAAFPLSLDWGPENEVVTIENSEFQKGSLALTGYAYTADELRPLREIFANAKTLHLFRLNSGGAKAACKYAEAKYPGKIGNELKIVIQQNEGFTASTNEVYDVSTYIGTTLVDTQKAVKAVYDFGQENVGAVYCSGQGGDQGTRALVNNLYGGTFTNPEHTEYTANSEENIKALELLSSMEGINFDASIAGGDEINLFCNGTLAMAFCWNVAQEKNNLENIAFDVLPMAFPTESGESQLCGGIWGFGIFDNGDEAKIEASKTFIDFMANDEKQVVESVKASSYWPVKDLGNIYEGDDLMTEYSTFIQYMGDYYQVVGGWAEARTAWWNMLQQIGSGADVTEAVEEFVTTANAAAAK